MPKPESIPLLVYGQSPFNEPGFTTVILATGKRVTTIVIPAELEVEVKGAIDKLMRPILEETAKRWRKEKRRLK